MERIDLVLLAAGKGMRFGNPVPKQFVQLSGKPLIVYSLEVFDAVPYIGTKYIVVAADKIPQLTDILTKYNISDYVPVEGGATRLDSVAAGVGRVQTRRVIIHLATMPFVTRDVLDRLVQYDESAVVPTLPLASTVSQGGDFMEAILDRSRLRVIQAPQLFDTQTLRRAHEKAIEEKSNATEDGQIVFQFGAKVRFIEGSGDNVDIKTHRDWIVAEDMAADAAHGAERNRSPLYQNK